MKKLILLVMVLLSFSSCMDDSPVQDCGTITSVEFSPLSDCFTLKENPTKPTYIIINTEEDLNKMFETCPTFQALDLPDFSKERILGLIAGEKPTEGYELKIKDIRENNCQIVVYYYEKEPQDAAATVITYPSDFVIMPKSNKPISFVKVSATATAVAFGDSFGMVSNNFPELIIEK